MLSKDDVKSIFQEHLPGDVSISFVERSTFIENALLNPFIARQVELGIYDKESIQFDFLSAAAAYPALKMMVVCYDLLASHAIGVTDDELTRAYITMIAHHEAHHFESHAAPTDAASHAKNEVECIRAVAAAHPELNTQSVQFEAQSLAYQRVYERMKKRVPKNIYAGG